MSKSRKSAMAVQGTEITVMPHSEGDCISLTDIARHKEPNRWDHVIQSKKSSLHPSGVLDNKPGPNQHQLRFL